MIHWPYCSLRLRIPSHQKELVPIPIQQSASSSRAAIPSNITAKGKEKAPTHDANSDFEILEVKPSVTCRTRKPFMSKAFQHDRAEVEKARHEGFTTKEEKKKPKGNFEVGIKRAIPASDNRPFNIYIGPAEGLASEYEFLGMYRDATSLCQDHLFINQNIKNIGCVSVHFCDVASPLGNMKDFIFSQVLGESVDWIKYLAKNPGRKSGLTAFLATGISKQRYITLQRSFLKDDVTPAELLNHYHTKKPYLCIVTFDHAEIPSEEARIADEENPAIPEPMAKVQRKRSRSMMQEVRCSTFDINYF